MSTYEQSRTHEWTPKYVCTSYARFSRVVVLTHGPNGGEPDGFRIRLTPAQARALCGDLHSAVCQADQHEEADATAAENDAPGG